MSASRRLSRSALLAAVVVLLTACGAEAAGPRSGDDVASVTVSRAGSATVWAGDTTRLQAVARRADGSAVSDAAVTWTSSDERIATVAAGVVTAHAAGTVTIAAVAGTRRGELALAVAGQELVYEGWPAGLPEPFVLSSGSGGAARLFPAGTVALDPTPSPDGQRIAFVVANYIEGTGDIYVADRSGANVRRLTPSDEMDDQPSWSPDGSRITYRSYAAGYDGDIWAMNADGSGAVNLTPDPLPGITDESRPAWSPDGRYIAYTSTAAGFSRNIWRMNADGSDKRRLTTAGLEVETEAAWSPDGARIAFRRGTPGSDIVVMNADGTGQTQLAIPGIQRQPAWSLDGRTIAFVNHLTTADRPELYTMRPDGSDLTLVAGGAAVGAALEPAWRRR